MGLPKVGDSLIQAIVQFAFKPRTCVFDHIFPQFVTKPPFSMLIGPLTLDYGRSGMMSSIPSRRSSGALI